MNTDTLMRRLAASQARGPRQMSLVNELLSFQEVPVRLVYPPGVHNGTLLYGASDLPGASWRNLKKRLISVGFVLKPVPDPQYPAFCSGVRMLYPELGLN